MQATDAAQPDREYLFAPAHEAGHVVTVLPRSRLLGRFAVTAIIILAVQGGIFWQLHRSSAAKRRQVAVEMQDFEMRAQALRSEMDALRGRIGETHGEMDRLAAQRLEAGVVTSAATPRPSSTGQRPAASNGKPRPPQPAATQPPRPGPIVLSRECASTPLGC